MRPIHRNVLLFLLASTVFAFASPSAVAQTYPARPVRLIVPVPPGGAADGVARILGAHLSPVLGQPVIVENRPGADGAIGAERVSKSPPDGYTFLLGIKTAIIYVPLQQKNPPYDPTTAFTPITLVGRFPLMLLVHTDVPAKSIMELAAYARANPGRVNYGTGNVSAILASAQFAKEAGAQMIHVPYKGDAAVLPDLVSGRIQMMITATPVPALAHVKEGRLRALASIQSRRSQLAPDVPTMSEAGFPNVSASPWAAIFTPANTAPELVTYLSRVINEALKRPDVRDQLGKQGFQAEGSSPDELLAMIRSELDDTRIAMRNAGMQPE